RVIERLYGNSHLLNDAGQYAYYGRVGGCLITGNEDGVKHCAMNILYSLQHLGYVIPPQADAGWIGEAGPGPSYLDPGPAGPSNEPPPPPARKPPPRWLHTLWLVGLFVTLALLFVPSSKASKTSLTYTEWKNKVDANAVKTATIDPSGKVSGELTNKKKYES